MAGARYKIQNPSGVDGLQYVSLQNEFVPRWTLTIWKRPEGGFANGVEVELKK
jgi:hypothetical protein